MKKLIYTMLGLFLITSCVPAPPCECETSANGFVLSGQSVNMGSEATVDVFKKIDAAWMVRDYETMKAHIADEGNYRFEDGTVVTNGEDFVAKVEELYQKDLADGVAWEWNTDYAFSVYPSKTEDDNWNEKGQWVNAQFTGSDGSVVIEWYQIDGDQLISWVQTKGQASKE
tara:strand:- start:137 stop:649 length:513 start_codon:yes stop_codon:yes gene_type:complete